MALLYVAGGGMNCVSCDKCVYHLGLFGFFPWVFLSSRVTEACPVTTDLIRRFNVREQEQQAHSHSISYRFLTVGATSSSIH